MINNYGHPISYHSGVSNTPRKSENHARRPILSVVHSSVMAHFVVELSHLVILLSDHWTIDVQVSVVIFVFLVRTSNIVMYVALSVVHTYAALRVAV